MYLNVVTSTESEEVIVATSGSMTNTSIRLSADLNAEYEELARRSGRSKNYLMTEALGEYIRHHAWWAREVQRGLDAADVADDEMAAFWAEFGTREEYAQAAEEAFRAYGLAE
jgi:predicted transcriptional regulator